MIAFGSDHAGYRLKETVKAYLSEKGIQVKDYGAFSEDACDYPDMAIEPCLAVVRGECELAILFCGTGIGISMAANKIKGIRAAACADYCSAKFTRLHNDANVLCLGERVLGPGLACELANVFLNTAFEGGRHACRVGKIMELEENSHHETQRTGGCRCV